MYINRAILLVLGALLIFLPSIEEWALHFPKVLDDIETLLTENRIFKQRNVDIGVIDVDTALEWGYSGPMVRSSRNSNPAGSAPARNRTARLVLSSTVKLPAATRYQSRRRGIPSGIGEPRLR